MWIFWALLSALTAATRRTNEKKLMQQLHYLTIGLMVQLLALPVICLAVLVRGDMVPLNHLGAAFWLPLVVVCVGFYPLNAYLYLQSVKRGELSKVLPIQSLWPVFSLLPAWLFLHEVPGPVAVIGVLLITLGVYALGLKGKRLHHPLAPFRAEQSSRYMLFAVMLVTAAGVLDKIAIEASNATFYSFMSTVGAVIVILITMRLRRINEFTQLKRSLTNLSITGSLQGTSYTTYLLAIASGPVAYATAIRSSNVLIGALLGIILFKERLTRPKIISFTLILFGGAILAIGS